MTDVRIWELIATVERLARQIALLENRIKVLEQTEVQNVNLGQN
ncbi:MAG: hypothetical protein SPH86_05345 [Eubacteriales bacterium]|nr:hypothetical protein [Faecalibacterium sp.]MDY3256564.1 hypothetical protein [Eubacteriales bacterium]MDY6151584.1 hypothetical protein [Eubacteriales bacterium]